MDAALAFRLWLCSELDDGFTAHLHDVLLPPEALLPPWPTAVAAPHARVLMVIPRSAQRGIALVLALSALTTRAAAGEPVAEALFDEGVRLLAQGKIPEACAALDRAVGLAGGTPIGGLLLLAECREKEGRPATAWATYRRAIAAARRSADAREARAVEAAARLEPTLPRVRVEIAPTLAARSDLAIHLDGAPLPREAWGLAVPVDPGPIAVEAQLPGAPPWQTKIEVRAGASTHAVAVLPWAAMPPREPAPEPRIRPLGIAGITAAALGAVGLGAGLGLAVDARDRYAAALALPGNQCALGACNATGKAAIDAARAQGNVATALAITGAALGVTGGALLTVDLLGRRRSPLAALTLRWTGAGVSLVGVR